MTEVEDTGGQGGGGVSGATMTGREKLGQLKARLFSVETQTQRVARALESLHKAVKPSNLDPATVKYIAQSADLEGE